MKNSARWLKVGMIIALAVLAAPHLVAATSCANVTSDRSVAVDPSGFPIGYILFELAVILVVVFAIVYRHARSKTKPVTLLSKSMTVGMIVIVQAFVFILVDVLSFYTGNQASSLGVDMKLAMLNGLGLSLGVAYLLAGISVISGLGLLFRPLTRARGKKLLLGGIITMIIYIPVYMLAYSTPHC